MEFVEEVLNWVGDLSSVSHGCDELALEPQYEYYQEPEPYQEQGHKHEHEHEQEQEQENDEQPVGEDQKEEGRRSSNDKKDMKNAATAAALGLGKAKVGAEKAKEKVMGKTNWIKDKCHHKDKVSK